MTRSRFGISTVTVLSLMLLWLLPIGAQDGEDRRFASMDRQATGFNLEGYWTPREYQEAVRARTRPRTRRLSGPSVNDAARKRADAYKGSLLTMPEWQCRPMQGDSIGAGRPGALSNIVDPVTRKSCRDQGRGLAHDRANYLDGRPPAAPRHGATRLEWLFDGGMERRHSHRDHDPPQRRLC